MQVSEIKVGEVMKVRVRINACSVTLSNDAFTGHHQPVHRQSYLYQCFRKR